MICALPGNESFAAGLRPQMNEAQVGLEHRRFPDGESYVRYLGDVNGRSLALSCESRRTLEDPLQG